MFTQPPLPSICGMGVGERSVRSFTLLHSPLLDPFLLQWDGWEGGRYRGIHLFTVYFDPPSAAAASLAKATTHVLWAGISMLTL